MIASHDLEKGIVTNENSAIILAPNWDRGECLWEISRESKIGITKILPEVTIEWAGEMPQGSHRARIRLVASHKTYLGGEDEKNMDGLMICRWRNLEIFECLYPQRYRARLDEEPIKPGEVPASEKYQIRAILLSDRKTPSPFLNKIRCLFEMKRY
jgi:hypothetical protein